MNDSIAVQLVGRSPFDMIRRVDLIGEYWSGRELAPLLGYEAEWRNMVSAVERARVSCRVSGADPTVHIGDATDLVENGLTGVSRTRQDYRLSRYGAYLVAMNGDPRKPEISAAQAYFTARTRQAELAEQPTEIEIARRYLAALEDREKLQAAVAALEPAANNWAALDTTGRGWDINAAAKILTSCPRITIGSGRLWQDLRARRWVYGTPPRPYQHAIDRGLLVVQPMPDFTDGKGIERHREPQVRITRKGLAEMHTHLCGSRTHTLEITDGT